MLVLSRCEKQKLVLITRAGEAIEIETLQIKSKSVRLGIVAPRDVKIYRGELIDRAKAGEPCNKP